MDRKRDDTLNDALKRLPANVLDDQPPIKRRQYTEDDAKAAVLMATATDGEGERLHTKIDSSISHQIAIRSLHRLTAEFKATGDIKLKPLGRKPRLSHDDEVMLAEWANYRALIRMAVSRVIFRRVAGLIGDIRYEQLHHKAPDTPWTPGKNWLEGYIKRMKDANVPVIVQTVAIKNAKAPTRVKAEEWFDALRDALDELGFMIDGKGDARSQEHIASRIINIDETGIGRYDGKKLKVMAPPHRPGALAVDKKQADHITLVGAIDAAGRGLPPFIILKGKRSPLELQNVKERTKSSPSNTAWQCSENGWITNECWMNVLEWIYALLKPTMIDPVMVITDNHSTRFNVAIIEWAMKHHIHVFVLPRNSTAIMQPLDLVMFRQFKHYLDLLRQEAAINMTPIDKVTIPAMICKAWEQCCTVGNIKSAWRAAGMERFGDNMIRTSRMPNENFHNDIVNIASSSSAVPVHANEWKAPRDVAHVLRTTAEERKAQPRRGKKVWEEVGPGLLTTHVILRTLRERVHKASQPKSKPKRKAAAAVNVPVAAACVAAIPSPSASVVAAAIANAVAAAASAASRAAADAVGRR